jgi:hypothetical protein
MERAIHQENAGMLSLLYYTQLGIQSRWLSNLDHELCELPVKN